MKRSILVAVTAGALLAIAPPAGADSYLDAAKEIGDYFLKIARRDGKAMTWPQYEGGPAGTTDAKRHFPVSFYSGVAGIGFYLLNLYRVTGEEKYLEGAKGAGLHLVKIAKSLPGGGVKWETTYERKGRVAPEGGGLGLYTGNAGIALFLMQLHKEAKDERFKKSATEGFERLFREVQEANGGWHWPRDAKDIIGGEAGIGLALLEMYRLTKEKRYQEGARKAARWLDSIAIREERFVKWATYVGHDANYSHGASGIAFFLYAAGEKASRDTAVAAARWIESVAKPCGEGAVEWEYYSGPPPKGRRARGVWNTWCHGAPGTVRLYILLHEGTGKKAFLETALQGGGGIRKAMRLASGKPFYYNLTYCCGAAGCLDAFCDLVQASKDARSLQDAKLLADDMIQSFQKIDGLGVYAEYDAEDQQAKKFPYVACGFMKGNAGVGFSLLKLSMVIAGTPEKLLPFPDQPFAHGKGK
ncbi:MAG: lanthionine synthetase LanC family protein [Planctomycetota bacterium]|jgi:lantibiotic modifying enzyme